jgi:putative membrane protein
VKSINTFVAIVMALIIVLFAVSNRAQVVVQVWPLPYQIFLGLYSVILWAVLIGFIVGLIVAWVMSAARRREQRESRRRIRDLEQSLDRHQGSLSTLKGS